VLARAADANMAGHFDGAPTDAPGAGGAGVLKMFSVYMRLNGALERVWDGRSGVDRLS
jgi:hypothetical protein